MVAAITYALFAVALVIVFGCFYVAWAMLSDLAAGWSQACRCGHFPRQFGIGLLFAMTAVFAIACFLLQGVRIDGLGEAIVMFAISLAWAAVIVYGFQCMLREYYRGTGSKRRARPMSDMVEPANSGKEFIAPSGNDDSAVEFERWLSAKVAHDSIMHCRTRPTSTRAMRSCFRVPTSEGPKGVKFGRV